MVSDHKPILISTSRSFTTLDTLPIDVLYHIIGFMPVLDIVRFRQTSLFFREVTGARAIWREAYRATSLPRDPGPFLHQSTATLKDSLIKSAKIARNWAPNEPIPTATRTFQDDRYYSNRRLFMGRWFMGIQEAQHINCTDLDSASGEVTPRVIYSCEGGPWIKYHAYLSTTSPKGHVLKFAVVHEAGPYENNHPRQQVIKIFRIDDDEGAVPALELMRSYSISWPYKVTVTCTIGPRLLVVAGDINDQPLYIDLETFQTYEVFLPPVKTEYSQTFIPSATQLLVIRNTYSLDSESENNNTIIYSTVFNVFAIPPSGTKIAQSTLQMSHQGHHPNIINYISLLYDPCIESGQHESCMLLHAIVNEDSEKHPFRGIVRISMSPDNSSIACDIQNISPMTTDDKAPSLCIQFADGCSGSSRGVQVRDTEDGIRLDMYALTLLDDFKVEYLVSSNVFLGGMYTGEWVVGVDGLRGRVLLSTEGTNLDVFTVLDFA
ncbi:hypothetical protein BJ138DRAFT_1101953 [Hygrophoropsis aurantiaca]|uniref:Uncharacterized protein n=1 Tax=Hygrophoropsis aurantiaca TaxID=72124 RepID=A0ACB8AA19_9AGAM|nr:hypothetical protein BJ138DRAFT_1101953 [Hygrophoropsis aurantiaca]